MNDEYMQRSGGLRDLVPADWDFAKGRGFVAVRCYRAMVEQRESIPDLMTFDIPGARLILLWGEISYIRPTEVSVTSWLRAGMEVKMEYLIDAKTPEGAHLLVVCPVQNASMGDATRFALDAAVAVALLVLGENIAHSQVCEFVEGPDGRPTATLAAFRAPILFPETGLPRSAVPLRKFTQALLSSSPDERARLSRSLRWLADGMAKQGADSVLSMWIALETLTMEETTNIRPINERLALAYHVTLEEASRRFLVGRLQNLRSSIVHRGFSAYVSPNVTRYMRAVFMDCICQELGIPSHRVAEIVLADGAVRAELEAVGGSKA